LVRYVKKIISLRRKLKIFNQKKFFTGKPNYNGIKDLTWYTEKGKEFADADWYDGNRKSLSYCVHRTNRFVLCIFNGDSNDTRWKLPPLPYENWNLLLDSSDKFNSSQKLKSGGEIEIPAWSVLLFEIKK